MIGSSPVVALDAQRLGEVNMGVPEKEAAILLTEYLETPQSEWVHRDIEGKPDSYDIDVEVPRPEGGTVVVRTNAHTIRFLINAAVQTIVAESLDN